MKRVINEVLQRGRRCLKKLITYHSETFHTHLHTHCLFPWLRVHLRDTTSNEWWGQECFQTNTHECSHTHTHTHAHTHTHTHTHTRTHTHTQIRTQFHWICSFRLNLQLYKELTALWSTTALKFHWIYSLGLFIRLHTEKKNVSD